MMTNHVGTKLGLAFGLLIAILIGIGFFAVRRMDQINADLLSDLADQRVKLQLAREALAYSSQNSRITMEIFLLNEKRHIDPLLATRAANTQSITELVSKIERQCDTPAEKQMLAAVKGARAPYVQSYLRALHVLLDEHKVEAARSIMVQETTPALFKYHAAWAAFLKLEMDEMDQGWQREQRSIRENPRLRLLHARACHSGCSHHRCDRHPEDGGRNKNADES